MASYVLLVAEEQADQLRQQVRMAIAVSAFTITNEPPATVNHANRMQWAKNALGNPEAEVDRVIWWVLAANASATIPQIQAATDAAVQTNVDAAVALFSS